MFEGEPALIPDTEDVKPDDWDDNPYLLSDELQEKLLVTPKLLEDEETINPEYLRLE